MKNEVSERETKPATEEILNEAGEESFPASDPIAWTLGVKHHQHQETTTLNQLLSDEHHLILLAMRTIHQLILMVEQDKIINAELVEQLCAFYTGFIEQYHHQNDEKILSYLQRDEGGLSRYLVNDLIQEHHYGKRLFADLSVVFRKYQQERKAVKMELLGLLKNIYDLYTNHLAKEDEYMLPAITALLDSKIQNQLATQLIDMKRAINMSEYEDLFPESVK